MCVSPIKLISGVLVSCHKCWQCRENRVRDWCGRCIAESVTAKASHSVTLTYGRDEDGNSDHLRATVLTYSDVQKYLKRLRKAGYPARYFVAGELGSSKGRAHWHIILYWTHKIPPHVLRKNFQHEHWPHGHTFWDDMNYQSVRYVCKYLQKDTDKEGHQSEFHMSKKPPLGSDYFKQRAWRFVDAGLAPQDAFYSFPGVVDQAGKKINFQMAGRSLDLFCQAFLDGWKEKQTGFYPHSEMIEAYRDRVTKSEVIFPLSHPLATEIKTQTVVRWDEQGNGTWHEKEIEETLLQRWQREHPGTPFPGRHDGSTRRE